MNKHEEALWRGMSILEDDIEISVGKISFGDTLVGYLVYHGDKPYIVGELIEVDSEDVALEYWIPVSITSLQQIKSDSELKQLKKIEQQLLYDINLLKPKLAELSRLQEKEKAMKPISKYDGAHRTCAVCNAYLGVRENYCAVCGKKLDWSDEE